MTQQRDLIAHQVTSLRIVVPSLAVKNFLPKAGPPARFHAGCRKIGHSRYNSVTTEVGLGCRGFRLPCPACAGFNDYGVHRSPRRAEQRSSDRARQDLRTPFDTAPCLNCLKSKRWFAAFALPWRARRSRRLKRARVPAAR